MKNVGERIKQLRAAKNLTQLQLAESCGTSSSLISMYETGKATPPDDIKIKLADMFGVTVDYLLGRSDETGYVVDKEVIRLPIVGVIRAGEPILAVENYEGHAIIERRFLKKGFEYFFLKVTGDSMDLIAPEGSLVLVRKQHAVDDGDICVVLVNRQEATIKRFYKRGSCITLIPASKNQEHEPQVYDTKDVDIKIIGKAEKVIASADL